MPNTIAQNLERLQDARDDIASAIADMGGTVAQGAGLEDFPAAILGIPSGATVIPLSSSSGYSAAKVYAVYYEGMLSVFGSDSRSSSSVSRITYTFPSSLAGLGVQTALSGMATTKNAGGTETKDISLSLSSTSFTVNIRSATLGNDFIVSGAFTPTT